MVAMFLALVCGSVQDKLIHFAYSSFLLSENHRYCIATNKSSIYNENHEIQFVLHNYVVM